MHRTITGGRSAAARFGRRLLDDTNGQVLLLGAVIAVALFVFMLAIPNGTHAVTQKVRAQTAADAGALTGSIWLARGLNLNANMNVGIRSVYTWMTVLTMGSALAQALYSDTHDVSVQTMGEEMSLALFNNADPVYVSTNIYPQSIDKLAETVEWLSELQDDISGSFPVVAQMAGATEARRNASGGDPASQNPGGSVLIRVSDSLSLEKTAAGDSLVYSHLLGLAPLLESIPTNDSNIGPATGEILVDSNDYGIRAYYGDSSEWCTVRQVLKRLYKKPVIQTFQHKVTSVIDSGIEYFQKSGGGPYTSYLQGDSWARWVLTCQEESTHTPFIWPNGYPTPPYKNTTQWTLLNCHPGNNRYKRDTVWVAHYVVRKSDPAYGSWNVGQWEPGDSILPGVTDSGLVVDSTVAYPTDFYTGAESTDGNQGAKQLPRRAQSDTGLYAVSFVWRKADTSQTPSGLGPPLGGALYPHSQVAASCPLLAVARAEAFLAIASPTEEDYFFSPNWDVRLTPIDSVGVADVSSDTVYINRGLDCFDLEELRRYVLLP